MSSDFAYTLTPNQPRRRLLASVSPIPLARQPSAGMTAARTGRNGKRETACVAGLALKDQREGTNDMRAARAVSLAFSRRLAATLALAFALALAGAPDRARAQAPEQYSQDELVGAGHRFFGQISGGLASVIERAVQQYGQPNGYILGEEGSGAILAGARYGEGALYTRNAGTHKVFWQGPSFGWDFGGDGARVVQSRGQLRAVELRLRRSPSAQESTRCRGSWCCCSITRMRRAGAPRGRASYL